MSKQIEVKLVYCPTCPILESTRQALVHALDEFGREKITYSEVNVHAAENPPELKHWPSPTILINEKEFEGIVQNPDQPCRLFEGDGEYPDREKLVQSFRDAQNII